MIVERKSEVLVGITVTVAIIVLTLSVIWGKGISFVSHKNRLVVRFDNVAGLEKGDPVVIRGIKQGEVENRILKPTCAEVRLWLRDNVPLYSDLEITIESPELMGGRQIKICPGKSNKPVDFSKVFYGKTQGDVADLVVRIDNAVSKVDSLFLKFRDLLGKDRLSRILQNVEETTDQAKLMVQENRKALRLSLERLDDMTRQLQEDSTVIRIGDIAVKLDSTVYLMKLVTMRMEKEEGTLGKLLRDRDLYDQLLKTSADLDSLVTDIKAHPKNYIHVSVF